MKFEMYKLRMEHSNLKFEEWLKMKIWKTKLENWNIALGNSKFKKINLGNETEKMEIQYSK